jgi:hypothetical protein
MYYESEYLEHHGIKGQRWGVRRYQNADGSYTKAGLARYTKNANKKAQNATNRSDFITKDHTIPAGVKMYRSTMSVDSAISDGPTYVTYTDVDRNTYRGGWVRNTAKDSDSGKYVIEHEYELKEDLKIPSRDRVKSAVADAMKDPQVRKDAIQGFANIYVQSFGYSHDTGTGKQIADSIVKNFGNKTVDDQFVNVTMSLGVASKAKQRIIENLSKDGYNAMTDEASVLGNGGWAVEGYDPLIIFNANQSLVETDINEISSTKEYQYRSKTNQWRDKHYRYTDTGTW